VEPLDPNDLKNVLNDAMDMTVRDMENLLERTKTEGKDTWKKDMIARGMPDTPVHHGCGGAVPSDPWGTFIMEYYTQLASFAAVNFAKFGRGALFVFTKIAWEDLFDVDPDSGATKLDRSFFLVWGGVPLRGKANSQFSAKELVDKFIKKCTTLPVSLQNCSEQSFPLVICCDPSGDLIPEALVDLARPAKDPDPEDARYSVGQQFTCVTTVRFLNFQSMLDVGGQFPEMEVSGVNIDRNYLDPNVT
jgi:hypothetical protein